MKVTEERDELFKALSAAQGEFTTVDKGKDNPFFKSKYAPLDSIIEMIRPILPKHGLAAIQFTDIPEDGNGIVVETIITHESGQYISGKLLMPLAKLDPQGAGSAITYGRRYALAAALGIVSDEDVDGNQGEGKKEEKKPAATKPADAQQSCTVTEKDAEYIQRIKDALKVLYGDDKVAALNKIEELTSFVPKGKTEASRVKGIREYHKLSGQRLQILCYFVEKLANAATETGTK